MARDGLAEHRDRFPAFLIGHKNGIVAKWLDRASLDFKDRQLLLRERDRFRNPVGVTLNENLALLFDALVDGAPADVLKSCLEPIVRLRAVQDSEAGKETAFILDLKEIVRGEMKAAQDRAGTEGFAAFEIRVAAAALVAEDLLNSCRARISEIKANEALRRTYVSRRLAAARPARTSA